jgi:hypothetical protein
MPFVKLDCGILDSSVWVDRPQRDLFITALLMAQPFELDEETPQYHVPRREPGSTRPDLRQRAFGQSGGCRTPGNRQNSGLARCCQA